MLWMLRRVPFLWPRPDVETLASGEPAITVGWANLFIIFVRNRIRENKAASHSMPLLLQPVVIEAPVFHAN